jgi:sugar/nucleoside kinase (ribokinase family)
VKVDPERPTALVLLGIRDDQRFPLIFYRENWADMELTEADIDEGFVAEARAVRASGTHLILLVSHPRDEQRIERRFRRRCTAEHDAQLRPAPPQPQRCGNAEDRKLQGSEVGEPAAVRSVERREADLCPKLGLA